MKKLNPIQAAIRRLYTALLVLRVGKKKHVVSAKRGAVSHRSHKAITRAASAVQPQTKLRGNFGKNSKPMRVKTAWVTDANGKQTPVRYLVSAKH